jgi:hypothetical protein
VLDEIRLADTAEPYLLLGDFVCGDAALNGGITATDALAALKTAVGSAECPPCTCDVNNSSSITAVDASMILRAAVGQPIALGCRSASSDGCRAGSRGFARVDGLPIAPVSRACAMTRA